ncbi:MAG: GNAT family N-acetyltransferase [Chloroflexi bacterium]|nr:GNAT family N-acetyltransferase [Chloroflexota bacterium]
MAYSVNLEDFESVESDWEQLLPQCSANTIFITPLWQKIWWARFGKGAELRILSIRDDDDIIGIAPLMLKDGVLSFIGDTDLFDYHDFIVAQGNEDIFYNVLCDHLHDMDWRALELKSLPEGSPTLRYISELAGRKGVDVSVAEEGVSPVAPLPSTWDEYLEGLSKKDRHELRRKLRRLESADGSNQYACTNPQTITCCMQDFFKLMRASSPDKEGFLTPERESFFNDIAQELTSRSLFKLYFLEINNVRVASCICFDYAGTYLLYNSGYDPEYSSFSVGLLNKALCIKEAIEEGRRSFDFLRGAERYKYHLGGKDKAVYRMVIRR